MKSSFKVVAGPFKQMARYQKLSTACYRKMKLSGQVLLEFAVGLPLLLSLLFFIVESGFYLTASQACPTALHDGSLVAVSCFNFDGTEEQNIEIIREAMITSMERPGVINPVATVNISKVGKNSNRRILVLTVKADYEGVTPLRKMFFQSGLRGSMILPLGDWGKSQ